MKSILRYLKEYSSQLNLQTAIATTLLAALLITLNYTYGIESGIRQLSTEPIRILAFTGLYTGVLSLAYCFYFGFTKQAFPKDNLFYVLLFLAGLFFALKMAWNSPVDQLSQQFTSDPDMQLYWYKTLTMPFKCVQTLLLTWLVWKAGQYPKPLWGMTRKDFHAGPYFMLLLMMVPLIIFAATQADFLQAYPRLHRIAFARTHTSHFGLLQLLYELAYGIDFLTIETFFRGFLVLAFVRYAGKGAILPMAAFYCCVHFGKPMFECISSYMGGLILGVVVYNTRSIWGGLIVHLGIAWLMELAGYLGHQLG